MFRLLAGFCLSVFTSAFFFSFFLTGGKGGGCLHARLRNLIQHFMGHVTFVFFSPMFAYRLKELDCYHSNLGLWIHSTRTGVHLIFVLSFLFLTKPVGFG